MRSSGTANGSSTTGLSKRPWAAGRPSRATRVRMAVALALRDPHGLRGDAVRLGGGQVVARGEPPGPADDDAHAKAFALAARDALDAAGLDGDVLLEPPDHAHVGVRGAQRRGRVEGTVRDVAHCHRGYRGPRRGALGRWAYRTALTPASRGRNTPGSLASQRRGHDDPSPRACGRCEASGGDARGGRRQRRLGPPSRGALLVPRPDDPRPRGRRGPAPGQLRPPPARGRGGACTGQHAGVAVPGRRQPGHQPGRHLQSAVRWLAGPARRSLGTQLDGAPEAGVIAGETRAELNAALAALPRDARAALALAAEGFSGAEIAACIGRTELATRTLICRARLRLRTTLEGAEGVHEPPSDCAHPWPRPSTSR